MDKADESFRTTSDPVFCCTAAMYHSKSETRSSVASLSVRDALVEVSLEAQSTMDRMANTPFGIQLHDDGERAEKLDLLVRAPKQVVGERPCLW